MKNILAGIVIAWLVPNIPTSYIYLASAIISGALLALAATVVFTVLDRNRRLAAERDELRQQLQFSEERRRAAQPRRKPSMRKGRV